jgi:four helix bundle protein
VVRQNELEYHLLLAKDLHLLQAAEFTDLEARVLEIQRMLASFAATVKSAVAS